VKPARPSSRVTDLELAASLTLAAELLEQAAKPGASIGDMARLGELAARALERLCVSDARLSASPAHRRFAAAVEAAFDALIAANRACTATPRLPRAGGSVGEP